jgi:uncharacterized protein YbcI
MPFDLSANLPKGRKVAVMTTDEQQATESEGRSSILMEVANTMVALYKAQFGRGPTQARAVWATDEALVVFLEDTLAPVERSMVRMGEHQRLRDMRMFFQYATVAGFCEPVERITGRKVRSFLSGIDTEVDGLSMETFILHPVGYDGPSRIDLAAEAPPRRDGGYGRDD